MKIDVLINNRGSSEFEGEHGLSLLVRGDKKVLFDAGPSGRFLENASKKGIDLREIDAAVLSHGHYDHGNGLVYLWNIPLVCHPDCFLDRYSKSHSFRIGLPFKQEEAQKRFDLKLTQNPFRISDRMVFLGEIPRSNDFEAKDTRFRLANGARDDLTDDSALAVMTDQGLVVIAGCAHSGICNIVEQAKKVTGEPGVYSVGGGFHLSDDPDLIGETVDYLRQAAVRRLFPMHCTGDVAQSQFKAHFNSREPLSGETLEI